MAKTAQKEEANGKLTPAEQKLRIEAAQARKDAVKADAEVSRAALNAAVQFARTRYIKVPTRRNYRFYVEAVNRASR